MQPVFITYKASKNVIRYSRQYEDETGGILVGTLDPLTIVEAAGPGTSSVHQAVLFTSDPQADKNCLNRARKQYGRQINPVGWWHKHPTGFNRPSSMDCQQVLQLAEEYNDNKPILVGIVNRIPRLVHHKTTLHLYSLGSDGNLTEHDWKLARTDGSEIIKAIKKATATPPTRKCDYWNDADFQFYQNPKGRIRIKKELAGLSQAGWQVVAKSLPPDKILLLELSKSKTNLYMVLPPEYPLNLPIVLTRNGEPLYDLRTLRQWSSLFGLIDIANESMALEGFYSFQHLLKDKAKTRT